MRLPSHAAAVDPRLTKVEGLSIVRRKRIAPVDVQRERIQGARVGDGTAQRCDTVFVDCRHGIQRHGWSHVVDHDRFAVGSHACIVVGHRGADRVDIAGRTRWIVVQVLVCQRKRLTARGAGAKRICLRVVGAQRIAPVDVQREGIRGSRYRNDIVDVYTGPISPVHRHQVREVRQHNCFEAERAVRCDRQGHC